jgi:hypothetical protein
MCLSVVMGNCLWNFYSKLTWHNYLQLTGSFSSLFASSLPHGCLVQESSVKASHITPLLSQAGDIIHIVHSFTRVAKYQPIFKWLFLFVNCMHHCILPTEILPFSDNKHPASILFFESTNQCSPSYCQYSWPCWAFQPLMPKKNLTVYLWCICLMALAN